MILETDKLQEIAAKIIQVVDTDSTTSPQANGDKVELVVVNNQLQFNVTNKVYYARVNIDNVNEENFRAVVDAKLFLNLLSKITTKTVELSTTESTLVIKANGNYKIPQCYDKNDIVKLEEIVINNATTTFNIPSETLLSISNYNAKEITTGTVQVPIQKLIWVDEQGGVSFTGCACVNDFKLDQPIKLLLDLKLVKLFKLFKGGEVKFTIGYDEINGLIQTKVKFENDEISITAITPTDDKSLKMFPTAKIRERANTKCDYVVELNRDEVLATLNRLMLFNNARGGINKTIGALEFTKNTLTIYDAVKENREQIKYPEINISETYSTFIDIDYLKATLDSSTEELVTLGFGNHQCLILSRGSIKNVIQEAHR